MIVTRAPGLIRRGRPGLIRSTSATRVGRLVDRPRRVVAAGGPYLPGALNFDGSNDYLLRGGTLTGIEDGKTGLISAWVKFTGGDGSLMRLISQSGDYFLIQRNASGDGSTLQIVGKNSGGSNILVLTSSSGYAVTDGWLHVLASWNLATPAAHFYINDADAEAGVSTETDDNIKYTDPTNWAIGATTSAASKINADLAEVYFAAEYLDISQEANRRKFIDATGKAVSLGADGSTPTGSQPVLYLRHNTGAAVTDFATNLGSGGSFSITGTLVEATGPNG